MLTKLFPRFHRRYTSLPILGPILDGYAQWLLAEGYPPARVRFRLRGAARIERNLAHKRISTVNGLERDRLRACAPARAYDDPHLSAAVRSLERYLQLCRLLAQPARTRVEQRAAEYGEWLVRERGLTPSTAAEHVATISRFLTALGYEKTPSRLTRLTSKDIEAFIRRIGAEVGRPTLQHVISRLRGFLRFALATGELPVTFSAVIDAPRVYRGEKLPRALAWGTVRALLRSVDRSKSIGRRDYAMLLLIATYGLRTSDIAGLKLEDIDWRTDRIHIDQRKTGEPLLLPLTNEAGAAIVSYLRHGRPKLPFRQVFLRARAPRGTLKATAVTEAFQRRSSKSGLSIPFQGPHCMRHSFAVHLLRQGASLKTIGDLLGHRTAEATCVYLRLAVEDLRDVALALPPGSSAFRKPEKRA